MYESVYSVWPNIDFFPSHCILVRVRAKCFVMIHFALSASMGC